MKQIFMCNYAAAAGADEYNFDNSELSQCENDIQPMSIGSPTKGRVIADNNYGDAYKISINSDELKVNNVSTARYVLKSDPYILPTNIFWDDAYYTIGNSINAKTISVKIFMFANPDGALTVSDSATLNFNVQ